MSSPGADGSVARRIFGHVQESLLHKSRHLGRHAAAERLSLAVSFNFRNPAGFADLLKGLYDPADSRYHQFLTAEDFRSRYAPTDAEVEAVARYFEARGLRVRSVSSNNMLLNVEGSTSEVESAFRLELHDFLTFDGRRVFAPTSEPLLFETATEQILAINGLSTIAPMQRPHSKRMIVPHAIGLPSLTPSMIRTAYGTGGLAQTGAGETLALFELDGYKATDITKYTTDFGLPAATLENVLVSDGTSTPTGIPISADGQGEVTLDIELALAMAPALTKILVYEAPNTGQGVINLYNKIASDNRAKEVSVSWGLAEDLTSGAVRAAENTAFQQMSSQGQSIFVAAGDEGAYDDSSSPTTLDVDDPASQPYVTSVGGTQLTANTTTGAYSSETTWSSVTTTPKTGGGGGISKLSSQPAYQSGLNTVGNLGSSTNRMVPDVALDADPNSGYVVALDGAYVVFGGTSCAAPLWAAFMALVNQARTAGGLSRIGFANPAIYAIGKSTLYAASFNDIADASTNLFYPATAGYDLATGWGTIKGPGLFSALTAALLPPLAPATLTLSSSATKLNLTWSSVATAATYKIYRSATGAAGTYVNTGTTATLSFDDTTAVGLNYYEVTAVNAAAESVPSAAQLGSINESPPSAPSGLQPTIGVSR